MDKIAVEIIQQYFWVIVPVVIVASLSLGIWADKKFREQQRAAAMDAEVDKYDSDEPVGDVPYHEKP